MPTSAIIQAHAGPLSGQIYSLLRNKIVLGQMPASHHINQIGLARQLGVSTVPLREALGKLEQSGMLTSCTNRGYRVSTVTADDLKEAYELRLAIEPSMLAESARLASMLDQRSTLTAFRKLETAVAGHAASAFLLESEFYLSISRSSRRCIGLGILEDLHAVTARHGLLQPWSRHDDANDIQEHDVVLRAFMDRDSASVEKRVISVLRKRLRVLQSWKSHLTHY